MIDRTTITAIAGIIIEIGIAVALIYLKMPPEGLWWHTHPDQRREN